MRTKHFSLLVTTVFFFGFGLWATVVEMDEGAVASGIVVFEGNRKIVQAVEQGKLRRINAKEGEIVQQGAVLFELENLDIERDYHETATRRSNAKKELELVSRRLESLSPLSETQLVAKIEIDTLKSQHDRLVQELLELESIVKIIREKKFRLTVTSPASGQLVDLQVFTTGGIVAAGQQLVTVAPKETRTIIQASVLPTDRDVIHPGQPVRINFVGLPRKSTPFLEATVRSISDDLSLPPDKTNELKFKQSGQHYVAQIELNEGELERLPPGVVKAGMPTDVLFKAHRRTFFEYMISPIALMMSRAIREE